MRVVLLALAGLLAVGCQRPKPPPRKASDGECRVLAQHATKMGLAQAKKDHAVLGELGEGLLMASQIMNADKMRAFEEKAYQTCLTDGTLAIEVRCILKYMTMEDVTMHCARDVLLQ